jgi:hypothetical protein
VIAIERAGLALAALADMRTGDTPFAPPDQQVMGQYAEACGGQRGEKG